MSKLILYDAISAQIKAEVAAIKAVQLWNNQVDNEKEEEARIHPSAYIEFSSIVWDELTKGSSEGQIVVTIKTVIERLQTDDRTFLTIVDDVYKALQLFQGVQFTPLKRIAERQDTDHDNVIVWESDFSTLLVDCTADTDQDKPTVTATLDLDVELDIDNDVIRTGDGE